MQASNLHYYCITSNASNDAIVATSQCALTELDQTHTHTRTHAHPLSPTHKRIYICACMYVQLRVTGATNGSLLMCVCVRVWVCIHVYMHAYLCMYLYMYIQLRVTGATNGSLLISAFATGYFIYDTVLVLYHYKLDGRNSQKSALQRFDTGNRRGH